MNILLIQGERKKARMFKTFMTAAALLLVFSCGTVLEEQPSTSTDSSVTPESVPIQVKAGDTFNIVLEANPGTGYSWQIDAIEDTQLVKQDGSSQYIRDDAPRDATGVGGREIWSFITLGGGSTTVTFRHVPEEPGRNRDRTIEFLIEIRD